MKDTRTEKIVDELKETITRLNKLDSILQKMDVNYSLYRKTRDTPWLLEDVIQKVEY